MRVCLSDPFMRPEVLLLDYGMGNLKSVARALEACGCKSKLVVKPTKAGHESILILPGVGAFPAAMKRLRATGMVDWIRATVAQGAFLLGICLGMQLLMEHGEEFEPTEGVGLIPGKVKKIPSQTSDGNPLKLPHIGWSGLFPPQGGGAADPLWKEIPEGASFYFVHSYVVDPVDRGVVKGYCQYGQLALPALVRSGRVVGCQFHPEKSGPLGLGILGNFLRMAENGRGAA